MTGFFYIFDIAEIIFELFLNQEEEECKSEKEKKQNIECPSTSGEKVKPSKRKIEDKLEEYSLVMKTRRLSKIRNKRTKV